MSIHLETDRLILRDWKDEDRAPFARMNSDYMIMEYFPRRLNEKESDHLIEKFQKHIDTHGYGAYAVGIKETGEFIGFVGLLKVEIDVPFAPAVEIAWRLDYGQWGKGYATEAGMAVLEEGFGKHKLGEIVGYAVHDNNRAIKVMEKFGMRRDPEGDFRYPHLSADHPLGGFVLYRLPKKQFKG